MDPPAWDLFGGVVGLSFTNTEIVKDFKHPTIQRTHLSQKHILFIM